MGDGGLLAMIDTIKTASDYQSPTGPLRSLVLPRLWWKREPLEQSLSVTLPPALNQLWSKTSGLVMFWDIVHGQWGLVLWSPDQTRVRHPQWYRIRREDNWRKGDLIIGEFLGDSDLLIIRCDPSSPDFGSVLISVPIDPRDEWATPGVSLTEFLQKFWDARGAKFWLRTWG